MNLDRDNVSILLFLNRKFLSNWDRSFASFEFNKNGEFMIDRFFPWRQEIYFNIETNVLSSFNFDLSPPGESVE